MGILSKIFFCIVYTLVGLMIALVFCYLAGWDFNTFHTTMIVSPIFFGIWLFLLVFTGFFGVDKHYRFYIDPRALFGPTNNYITRLFRWPFWIWTVFCTLPIIMNFTSKGVGLLGFESAATTLYTHRYTSIAWVFLTVMILIIIWSITTEIGGWIQSLRRKFKKT